MRLLAFYIFMLIPLGMLASIVCKIFNISHTEIDLSPWKKLLVVFILAPIYEEIFFRSLLKFRKTNIILFFNAIFALILFSLYRSNLPVVITLGIVFTIFLATIFIFSGEKIELFVSSNFKYFFYASILLFGILHIFNFTGNRSTLLAFSFILCSPQLILGSILGYIRMNHGLVYSILFHMIVNSTVLLSVLGKL